MWPPLSAIIVGKVVVMVMYINAENGFDVSGGRPEGILLPKMALMLVRALRLLPKMGFV